VIRREILPDPIALTVPLFIDSSRRRDMIGGISDSQSGIGRIGSMLQQHQWPAEVQAS
jgi:hypothetical protein